MKLYELVEAYQNIMELDMDQEDLKACLDSLQDSVDEKVENIIKVMGQLEAEQVMYKNEIDRLSGHMDKAKAKHTNIKEWLSNSLQAMEIDKMQAGTHKISFRKSESVSVDNLELVPKEFIKEKITESADKTAIKKALKLGEVEGCHLVVKKNLQIK